MKKVDTMLTIVKLGGSVITEKRGDFLPNLKSIYKLSKEISNYLLEEPDKKLIIVHGGGSFPHGVAERYDIRQGLEERRKIGASLTSWAARKLNDIVTEALLDYGVTAFSLQPSSCFCIENDKVLFFSKPLESLLANRFVPVLYGDVVFTDSLGICSVFSGERIILELCKYFKPSRVILGTNVRGVFTSNPEIHPNAKFIEKIDEKNVNKILNLLKSEAHKDATGSIYHKVKMAYEIAKTGAICKIIDIKRNSLYKELKYGNIQGTMVLKNE